MDTSSRVMFIVWAILAIASFISAFWAPVVIAIINWIFGGLNILILGSLGLTQIQTIAEVNKVKKQVENEQMQLQEPVQPISSEEKGDTGESPVGKRGRKPKKTE